MIQTNTPYTHTGLASTITGILLVEVVGWEVYRDCIVYKIEDFIILENGAKQMINQQRTKRVEIEKINELDAYLATLDIDFASMPKFEREWAKMKHALLPFVQTDFIDEEQTKTIYNRPPNDWVLSE